MSINTTNISLETFKTITSSDGTFSTWADIIERARAALPVNEEIFGTPFKSMKEVTGDNIVLENTTTKFVEYLRDDLSKNNKLELDKMVMFLYEDYMSPFEYSIRDQKSAKDWASIISEAINQMFISKQDVSNALAADEIVKVALALGNFTIVENASEILIGADGTLEEKAFKTVGIQMRRLLNKYRTKRTKFAKGIDINRLKWVNSYDFSLNLLGSLTAGSASDKAFEATQNKNTLQMFLGTPFTQSMYLGTDFDMGEFTPDAGAQNGNIQNEGSFTGNLTKPYQLKNVFSISWLPESLLYYGHNFTQTDVPKTNSRTERVISFMWRAQVAILPIFAGFNHIFLDSLPNYKSYVKRNGDVVPAYNLSNFDDYKRFKLELRKSQPMLYNTLIDENGITGNGVKDSGTWSTFISDNTLEWAGKNFVRDKKTGVLRRK